jgi:sodium transport system ATP-binding protein
MVVIVFQQSPPKLFSMDYIVKDVAQKNSIEIADLSKSFRTSQNKLNVQALANVSFSCCPGLIYGLIGPNGAGKTTCLRIVSGLVRPTAGTIKVAGIDLITDPDKVRQKIGYVSTTAQAYSRLTARELLIYCGRLAQTENLDEAVDTLIRQMGICEFQDRYCGELSTGMKQRLAIARALVHNPEVLIFDEPTVGLDILARRDVLEMLATLKCAGRTILFSTHIPEEAKKLCDYFLVISGGRLVAEGTFSEVLIMAKAEDLEEALVKILKRENF